MAQFVRIGSTFVNLDSVRTITVDANSNQATVTWTAGDEDIYLGQQATNLINAVDYLKQISIAVPTPPDEPA